MCGIVGILNLASEQPIQVSALRQMLAMIRHRGPDQFGIYQDKQVGLGSARLSIIDLSSTGQQPIANEDGSLWIVFNGEIFNYIELRVELEARGHQFSSNTDTEVILHMYEDFGPDCLTHFNGQFAFAIWDTRQQNLFVARDRLGIRPAYYTVAGGALIFGSEIKAILEDPRVSAALDPVALDQIFTFWSPLSPRTCFQNIQEIPPGHYLNARDGNIRIVPYWQPTFPDQSGQAPSTGAFTISEGELKGYLDKYRELMIDATQIRLRADVPVGAYLSGGLDSSITTALIQNYTDRHLDTFSIAFTDPDFDESHYQQQMAAFLGTDHQVVHVEHADIGRVFPDTIWHTEIPIMRTSPAPMFLLSGLVHRQNYKVVLTGEGADEILAGYNIFKEAKVRRFWAKQPESELRPLLLKRLYPYIADLNSSSGAYLKAFFQQGLEETDALDYSHALRWRNTRRSRRFFSKEFRNTIDSQTGGLLPMEALTYPDDFQKWDHLQRAQYLELTIFMSQYLLSSQGDRMGMAHSVEGRFPFLDHRVVEFCNQLPPKLKLRGLTEKYLLKKLGQELLPDEIWHRPKRPYRAPIHRGFFNEDNQDYVHELLSPEVVSRIGLFNPNAVSQLVQKVKQGGRLSETDDMALVGVLSTLLVHEQFVSAFRLSPPLNDSDDVKIVYGEEIRQGI